MEGNQKILIVDDEKDLCEILEFNLESEGYSIDVVHSGEDALKKPLEEYDLILLDVMMNGITGFKVANVIRKEKKLEIPIIFLTAKTEENDILTGFNVGADDYISKPFSIKEVIARVKVILKRGIKSVKDENQIVFRNLKLTTKKKEITIDGQIINLTRKEYEILYLLMKNMGQYLSREEILKNIWSYDVIVTDRNVDVNIARLRKKIGEYSDNIKGKSGYGYCFTNN
jgi:DNA-binding response OmpR family regulator